MKLQPVEKLSPREIESGLRKVTYDGLATEAMTTLTGGTFLTAIALYLGASNLQIGMLASLPAMTNVSQVFAIWLVQRYRNRRAIAVVSSTLARLPLLFIGIMPLVFSAGTSVNALIFLLFFHYLFGSISGPGWNSWMKDLIPERELGSYLSHRGRLMQIMSVCLSLLLAILIDQMKLRYPGYAIGLYACMFIIGGLAGMAGVHFLASTPEPLTRINNDNIFRMVRKPLLNLNFRRLMVFQGAWTFALNMATPFYSVYVLKTLGIPLSYLVFLGMLTQVSSILSIRIWGRFTDMFSNKTVLRFTAPLYSLCILCWSMAELPASTFTAMALLVVIHLATGVFTSGINLSLGNIGLKIAPADDAISYIVVRSMMMAGFGALAPILGGMMADRLGHPGYVFTIASVCAILSLLLLRKVKEDGEVDVKPVFLYLLFLRRLRRYRG